MHTPYPTNTLSLVWESHSGWTKFLCEQTDLIILIHIHSCLSLMKVFGPFCSSGHFHQLNHLNFRAYPLWFFHTFLVLFFFLLLYLYFYHRHASDWTKICHSWNVDKKKNPKNHTYKCLAPCHFFPRNNFWLPLDVLHTVT